MVPEITHRVIGKLQAGDLRIFNFCTGVGVEAVLSFYFTPFLPTNGGSDMKDVRIPPFRTPQWYLCFYTHFSALEVVYVF